MKNGHRASKTPRLNPRAWRELFNAVYEVNRALDHADFGTAVVAAMARLVEADAGTFHAVNRDTGQSMLRMIPEDVFTPDEVAYYFSHPEEMPLVAYYKKTGATHARRMSDVIDIHSLTKTRYYENCLQRSGLRYFLTLPLQVDDSTVAGLAFNRRKRDFTLRDRALLDAFGPHVILAWGRHGDPWKVDSPIEDPARCGWLPFGLTPRESEILLWMTEGKQNREIAVILGISLATVQKHVVHILEKLDVENRHAATVHALRCILSPSEQIPS